MIQSNVAIGNNVGILLYPSRMTSILFEYNLLGLNKLYNL